MYADSAFSVSLNSSASHFLCYKGDMSLYLSLIIDLVQCDIPISPISCGDTNGIDQSDLRDEKKCKSA